VAKGCSQRAGLGYTETVSPVIRMASLRLFRAVVAATDLDLCQLDIDTAFLEAPIQEDVYICQPLGFSDGTRKVCHIKRCIYGLKQPPREFNMLLRDWLVNVGWQQCVSVHLLLPRGSVFAIIAMYVDDTPAVCNDMAGLTSFKARLGARFKIKDLGALSQLLGMHITRDMSAGNVSLDQSKYLRDIWDKHGITDCEPSPLPMDPGFVSGLARLESPLLCPHNRGKGYLSHPLRQPLVCGRMYAPIRLHNIEHHLLGSCTSNGGSPPSPQEGGPLPLRQHPTALHVKGGGGTHPSTYMRRRRRLGE
jgi:hypothetical protein